MISTHTQTQEVIASMLVENTGIHMLDSGGSMGRHWQRNAGKTVADFVAEPQASIDRFGVTLSVFHFLSSSLDYAPEMQKQFEAFCANDDDGWLSLAQRFFTDELWVSDDKVDTWNTYNGESALSQCVQCVCAPYEGKTLALVQVHNGADVRGGYTAPKAFFVKDHVELFPLVGSNQYTLTCPTNDEHSISYVGEYIVWHGSLAGDDELPIVDEENNALRCSTCLSFLEAHANF